MLGVGSGQEPRRIADALDVAETVTSHRRNVDVFRGGNGCIQGRMRGDVKSGQCEEAHEGMLDSGNPAEDLDAFNANIVGPIIRRGVVSSPVGNRGR